MKKMIKKKKLFRTATVLAAVVALGASLAGCGSSDGETTQRYSWPLATASPEDTVTHSLFILLFINVNSINKNFASSRI